MEAKDIAVKYVFGRHDALTDSQEVIDMIKDILDFQREETIKILTNLQHPMNSRVVNRRIKKEIERLYWEEVKQEIE